MVELRNALKISKVLTEKNLPTQKVIGGLTNTNPSCIGREKKRGKNQFSFQIPFETNPVEGPPQSEKLTEGLCDVLREKYLCIP